MILRRSAAIFTASLLLAGCGGGGGGSQQPTSLTPAAIATASPAATQAVTHATLTIKFPASFHRAKIASTKRTGATVATRQRPAGSKVVNPRHAQYINSTSGDYLDIWVDGNIVVDASDSDTGNVQATYDGTQQFSIPLTSTSAHQIVAVETDYGIYSEEPSSNVLAVGEYDMPSGAFAPGSAPAIGLTMLQNGAGVGITADYQNGSDAVACLYNSYCDGEFPQNYLPFTPSYESYSCSQYNDYTNALYAFTVDPDGGFVSAAGAGVALPTLQNWASLPLSAGNYLNAGYTGLFEGYTITYPSNYSSAVVMTMAVTNPASPIYNDLFEYTNEQYPGLESLVGSNSTLSNLLRSSIGNYLNYSPYNNDVYTMQIEVDAACVSGG